MKLFHEGESKIFKNESVLDSSFMPDHLAHREKELRELADILKVAADGRKPQNILISGPPGTGKTSSVKYVLNQLTDFTKAALPVYVNCWQAGSDTAILSEILNSLHVAMPRRGLAADEMTDRIFEILAKEKKVAIVVLDEVDRLVAQSGDTTLYRFSRSEEFSGTGAGGTSRTGEGRAGTGGAKIALIGITNDTELVAKVDERTRSSLAQRRMEFERYRVAELKDILKERAKLAFHSAVAEQDAIALCAAHAAKHGGDARVAIALLRASGFEAEKTGAAKVTVDNVRSAIDRSIVTKAERKFDEMSEVEQRIISLLKKGSATSGELMKELSEYGRERTVQYALKRLSASGIITEEEVSVKPKGKTRRFSIRI